MFLKIGALVDVHTVDNLGWFEYGDKDLGYENVRFEDNPAHEHTEPDGTVWSTTAVLRVDEDDENILHAWYGG